MSSGKHYHHFNIVLKAEVEERQIPEVNPCFREMITTYKQCECGCVNKTEMLVTHMDGRPWDD